MNLADIFAALLVGVGLCFLVAGAVGLLRFPDVFTRMHALTKADNLGLGFVAFGVGLHTGSWFVALKLLVIWLLVMLSSSTVCFLIARRALRDGAKPWSKSA